MEDLNLHFTGDIHAIGAANNLLAAALEAHLLHGNKLGIDPLTVGWRRCIDMNDRALRQIVVGLGGRANGYPRETGFDITAPSEVMAIVAVAGGGLDAVERGSANLERHVGIVKEFGLEPVVAVNRRPEDTDEECDLVRRLALEYGAFGAELNEAFARGGEGAVSLAEAVVNACEEPNAYAPVYGLDDPIADKIEKIAKRVYGASDVSFLPAALEKIERFTKEGLDNVPICMAKTHLSLSADPTVMGAPTDFTLPVRDLRAYTGAGWIVALCGDVMTMPGLGATPALQNVDIDESGRTVGLF